MCNYLAIDTSNYTTSVAVCSSGGNIKHIKKLLPVPFGKLGLRQNEAVFHHVQQLSELFNDLLHENKINFSAVGVSSKPRDVKNSYMPCFTVGLSISKILSDTLNIPCYGFSHQAGHIMAAIYSSGRFDLLHKQFLAFHVSGGTTEAVIVTPCDEKIISTKLVATSLDLTAGQLVDRVGLMLGLNFPAGNELEKLALAYNEKTNIKTCLKGENCCLSGVENICQKMLHNNEAGNKIARVCIDYILFSLKEMCENLLLKYGNMPIIFSGGVMSNRIIKENLSLSFDAFFAEPEFSSDNAAGIAYLTKLRAEK